MTESQATGEDLTSRQRIYEDLINTGKEELEYQIRIMLDRFDRTDRLIRLGVATLAGMIAVLGFLISQGPELRILAGILLGLSIVFAMGAIYMLVRINTSLHREATWQLGPKTGDVMEFVEKENTEECEYFRHMADLLPDYIAANTRVIQSMSARQGQAIVIIVTGAILHLGAIVFILGGEILG